MSTFGNILQLHVVIIKKKRKGPENERFSGVWEKKMNLAQLVQSFHLFHNLKKKDSYQEEKLYHF